MAGRVSVVPIDDSHADLLATFFRQTWDASASADGVLAGRRSAAIANLAEPGVAPPTFAAIQDDRVIGYCSSLPLRLSNAEGVQNGYWAKGLMVLPEFRGGPIGFHVLNALTKSQPLIAAVTVAEGSKRLFGALGYRDYGAIPNLIRHTRFRLALPQLRPLQLSGTKPLVRALAVGVEGLRRVGLAHAGGWIADAVTFPLWRSRTRPDVRFAVYQTLNAQTVNDLWERVKRSMGAHPVRDGRAWDSRYLQSSDYVFVAAERNGQLLGLSALKLPRDQGDPRLAGLRMASISDLLIDPEDPALPGLLRESEAEAARLGAGAVILSVSNRRLVDQARRQGYISRPGNIHFFLRSTAKEIEWPTSLEDWWLTRGDGESDASF